MQGLDKWWYVTGVDRVQVSLDLSKMVYFAHPKTLEPYILAVSKTGECQQFDLEGASGFNNFGWVACQVGQNRLLQASSSKERFRFLKMDPTQRCFSIERRGDMPSSSNFHYCLANLRDKFVFLIREVSSYRYSP